MIRDSVIQRVKDLSVKEVLEGLGLQFQRRGASYVCCCPLHGERSPSFNVNLARNTWHCFGCNKGGSAIDFLMERDNLTFIEAVKAIAADNNIEIQYDRTDDDEDEKRKEAARQRESMLIVCKSVQEFYLQSFDADNAEAATAREYAYSRWGEQFCKEFGIGYAPRDSRLLLNYIREKCLTDDIVELLGIFGVNERDGGRYAQLRQRVTIPIRDRFGRVIAFTGRYIGSNEDIAKYINSKTSPLFKKDETLFGLDVAGKQARSSNFFIVVEGAPDVMRLQSIGLTEAVAPLGTALTGRHLDRMKPFSSVIRFIPDSDYPKPGEVYGAGVQAVMKHGRLAMEKGFEVSVREIPRTKEDNENKVKFDPDSYITSRDIYMQLEDVPFVVWYAQKRFANADSQSQQMEVVAEVASLLIYIEDELTREMSIDMLTKIFGKTKMWRDAMRKAGKRVKEEAISPDTLSDFSEREISILRSLGIIIKDGCYQAPDKEGNLVRWSNFIFRPVLHIRGPKNSTRILRLIGQDGSDNVVEFTSGDLVSLRSFRERIIDKTNCVWRSEQSSTLIAIQEYIFAVTKSALKIEEVGWNKEGHFFVFANGIYSDGKFLKTDKLGTVSNGNRLYFIPALSELYANDPAVYNFERPFVHNGGGLNTLHDYVSDLAKVYGDGGKVCFAWLLAAIFRDIVFSHVRSFPMLNLFGVKGSGKTELAKAIASFFYVLKATPPSCSNASIPTIAYMLSHAVNGVVILDEYTNDLHPNRIDILKGIWGGTSRAKIEDGQPIVIPVVSAVILGGQYKPENDAVYSRCIHLQYMKTSFSEEEESAFNRFQQKNLVGNSHLLLEILPLRNIFEKGFASAYELTLADVNAKIRGLGIEARIKQNWIVALAAFRLLQPHLDIPLDYNEMFDIVVRGMRFQNEQVTKSSDTSDFWKYISSLHSHNKVREKCHYVIKKLTSFRAIGQKEETEFISPKQILFLNFHAVRSLLEQRMGKPKSGNSVSVETLEDYLKSLPQYMGKKQQRFQFVRPNGEPDEEYRSEGVGEQKKYLYGNSVKALCFDYDQLKEKLDINLETLKFTEFDDVGDEDEPPANASPAESPRQEPSLFGSADDEDVPF